MAGKVILKPASVHELDGEVVVRGYIDPNCLAELQLPTYQREVLSDAKIAELMQAHRTSRVPDVVLNMRGTRLREQDDGSVALLDDTYMVDGLQRITAGMRVMYDDEPATPIIGAYVTLGKDEEWEREQFEILNNKRTQLSPNINLRNQKAVVPAINTLHRLTHEQGFILRGRVQWDQAMKRGQLITATTFVKTVGRLHSHWGPGKATNVFEVATGVDRIMDEIGREALRANVKEFFEVLESSWDLQDVDYKGATILKSHFLFTLAELFAGYPEFWDGYFLTVTQRVRQNLRSFKVKDPSVDTMVSSAQAAKVLASFLEDAAFRGRRVIQTWDDVEEVEPGEE